MNILVIGGTRLMGRHLVSALLREGQDVTIATRGVSKDPFGDKVHRIVFERTDEESIRKNLSGHYFDVVFDSLAYCSEDVRMLLGNISCGRYIMISTTAVYDKHMDTKEPEFDPLSGEVKWCGRGDFPYDEIKRQAERALVQNYSNLSGVAVRFPFVLGEDDYTNRLRFYVEHIISGQPMHIDNYEKQMAFVRSDEAGKFLAFFAENEFTGQINGASEGTISIKEIAEYVERKTGKKPLLSRSGDQAPYNGETEYSINTQRARDLGFQFTPLRDLIFDLLDGYITQLTEKESKL